VYHYGIAWMPSELEQRVGRIDRVGSQTERRLGHPQATGAEEELLQVYYPHLNDTVEVLQLRRVYERLNRFMRIMHEGLGTPAKEKAEISVSHEGLRHQVDTQAIRSPLRSAFRVSPEMLAGHNRPLAVTAKDAALMLGRLDRIEEVVRSMGAKGVHRRDAYQVIGEMQLRTRVQPFTLLLRSLRGIPLLRCVSPIGTVDTAEWNDEVAASLLREPYVRLALEKNPRYESYDIAIEGDVLLGGAEHDMDRARKLIERVVGVADRIEEQLLLQDAALSTLAAGLNSEVSVAR
jgi:hypothetical protein